MNHTQKEYARGDVHENRAECLFSLLKPYLRVFRGISKRNFPRYVDFFQFLRYFRHQNAFEQAEIISWAALDPAVASRARRRELVSQAFAPIPDPRRPDRVDYSLHDTLMSGFAMMFFQYPNLLEFQRKMKQRRHQCNLETIFGVREVPSDTQRRDLLDGVPVERLRALLDEPAANQLIEVLRTGEQGVS